jgi:hypothetical protein
MADAYTSIKKGKLRLKKPKGGKSKSTSKERDSAPVTEEKPRHPTLVDAGMLTHDGTKTAKSSETARGDATTRASRRPRASAAASASAASPAHDSGDDAVADAKRTKPAAEVDIDAIVATIPGLTATQRKLEALKMRQEMKMDKEKVESSHRERVDRLNKQLASMPMHFDIPKTAAAGLG